MRHTSFEQVLAIAQRLDAQQPGIAGSFAWTRENADEVVIVVESTGLIRTRLNDVEQAPTPAGDYAVACRAILNLMNQETIR